MTEKWITILGTIVTIIANILAVMIGSVCVRQGYAWLAVFLAVAICFIDYTVIKYFILKYNEYRQNKR